MITILAADTSLATNLKDPLFWAGQAMVALTVTPPLVVHHVTRKRAANRRQAQAAGQEVTPGT